METEFKVGDKVKEIPDSALGIGVVESILGHGLYYPISVRYGNGTLACYARDGKRYQNAGNSPYIVKIKDYVWEVGQKVFDSRYGWGIINSVDDSDSYPIVIAFGDTYIRYSKDGREYTCNKYPSLSFTNYIENKFSQDTKDATYEQIEPDFDWGCLSAWCNDWIAKDKDGIWYSYKSKPEIYSKKYVPENYYTRIHPDYYPKNSDKIDWNNSIYKNPYK